MNKSRVFLILVLFVVMVMLGYQNCSKVAFTTVNGPAGNSNNIPNGGTATSIQTFQPALAVRDISCLACHANIQANVITDFGSPNSWYMGSLQNPTDFGGLHYMATTWQTMAQISGQVIVPQTTVPTSFVQSELQSGATAPNPVTLAGYLALTDMSNFGGSWYSYFGENTPATFAFTNGVTGGPTAVAVLAQSTVYVGAPTVQEILNIIPTNTAAAPWVQAVGASTTGVSGLAVSTGVNGQQYISTTTSPLVCSGQDVVVNGTLLLNNTQIYAEKGGCRFYVTGSVFIIGPITYLNSGASADPTDNLQITSGTSIIMGVGLNGSALNGDGSTDDSGDSPLNVRLISDVRGNLLFRGAQTSSAYTTYANSIMAEGNNIGLPLLQDASVPGNLPTALSAAKQPRANINFQHLLLNAPLIHSRYMGTVNGVIVSESAMFSLGEFSFNFDPVFQNVAVLPALPFDILCTSTPCNPANP